MMLEEEPKGERKMFQPKINYDKELFEKLYMDGRTSKEIAAELGCGPSMISRDLAKLDWPTNNGIFGWQKKLKPSEFALIPMKYRDKRLCV
jgi:uncharacterized protein YjcR